MFCLRFEVVGEESGDSDGALLPHSQGSFQLSRESSQSSSEHETLVGIGLLPCFLPSSVEPGVGVFRHQSTVPLFRWKWDSSFVSETEIALLIMDWFSVIPREITP